MSHTTGDGMHETRGIGRMPLSNVRRSAWCRGRRLVRTAACLLAGIICLQSAFAQTAESEEITPIAWPDTPAAIERVLSAEYLSPDEAKDKRIFFGRYSAADLDTPARAARAALIRGVFDDPSFDAAEIDPLDRAEAMVMRGDLADALALLTGKQSVRAVRLRALALEKLGKYDDAAGEADAVIARLTGRNMTDASEVVDAVRLLAQRIRIKGPVNAGKDGPGGAADYQWMIQTLGQVRTTMDRFSWPAILAEGELLNARDNKSEAAQAFSQAIEMNPTAARAWEMLGRLTIDGFQFDKTESIAARLDLLDGAFDPEHPDDGAKGASPAAAMLRARALLRQSEGALAIAAIAPALERFPKMPELLALKCAAEGVSFNADAAAMCLKSYDAQFPGSGDAVYEIGRALSESRQYAPAAAYLAEAHRRMPFAPEPSIDLGLLHVQDGQDDKALEALEKAFALDPFNVRADNSLRLVRELTTYAKVESPHFIVRYKAVKDAGAGGGGGGGGDLGGPDGVLAREMIKPLEENYRIVTGAQPGGIDHEPKNKTLIDLMPDHEWFAVRIAGMPQIHTIAASTGPLIAMEAPRDGPKHNGTYDWVRVLRHEYVHTVSLSRTNNRIPLWFTEAAAVYLELSPRDYSTCQMLTRAVETKDLFDFQQINLAFVRPKHPSDRSKAYAQGHWMYEYIVEKYGAKAPLDLMDRYAIGVREEEAFQQVLGVPRVKFSQDFAAWAEDQVRAWGLLPPAGQPTIRQLLAREAIKSSYLPEGVEKDSDEAKAHARALTLIAEARSPSAEDPVEAALDLDAVELPAPTEAMITAWLREFPTHPDVLELNVDQYVAMTGGIITVDAEPLFLRYAAARPVDPKPHRLLAKMYLDEAASDPSLLATQANRAVPHLEYLDAREQRTPLYAMELARRYATMGDFTKASAKAERATQIAPYDARTRELAATIAIQAKDLPTAERHIVALTVLEPDREIHRKRLEAVRKMEGK